MDIRMIVKVKNIEGTEKYSEHKKIINYLHS